MTRYRWRKLGLFRHMFKHYANNGLRHPFDVYCSGNGDWQVTSNSGRYLLGRGTEADMKDAATLLKVIV